MSQSELKPIDPEAVRDELLKCLRERRSELGGFGNFEVLMRNFEHVVLVVENSKRHPPRSINKKVAKKVVERWKKTLPLLSEYLKLSDLLLRAADPEKE